MKQRNVHVSIAIPLLNEEEVLPLLLKKVTAVLDQVPNIVWDLTFINDGSTDRTQSILEEAAMNDARISVVSFSRNFGHQAAVSAAMDHVQGEVLIVMDGDLQDPPEVLSSLIDKYRLGSDVVYVQRRTRQAKWYLKFLYFAYYRLLRSLSSIEIPLDSGDFALMSKRVYTTIRELPERHRFIRGLRTWVGFRQDFIEIDRPERSAGESKYNFKRLLKLAFDGVFSFSVTPLRWAAVFGVMAISSSALFLAYSLYVHFALNRSPTGFTATIALVTFFGGVQLLTLGIIGEYIGRIFEQTKGRPLYILDKIVRKESQSSRKAG